MKEDIALIIIELVILALSVMMIMMNKGQMDTSDREIILGLLEGSVVILAGIFLFLIVSVPNKMKFLKDHILQSIGALVLIVVNVLYVLYISGNLSTDIDVELTSMIFNVSVCGFLIFVSGFRVYTETRY